MTLSTGFCFTNESQMRKARQVNKRQQELRPFISCISGQPQTEVYFCRLLWLHDSELYNSPVPDTVCKELVGDSISSPSALGKKESRPLVVFTSLRDRM
jgi:hypothetical protein